MQSEYALNESRGLRSSESRQLRRIGAISATLALGLTMSACTPNETEAQPTVYVTKTVVPTPIEQQPLTNACQSRTLEDDKQRERDALECFATRSLAHVALINYSYSEAEAEQLAKFIELNIQETSYDVFDANIEVVQASADAKKRNQNYITNGCRTDGKSMQSSPSYIADSTMPSLKDYDMVIGVTDARRCDAPRTTGYAWSSTGRYGEILVAESGVERPIDAAITGAHEQLHLEAIGHDSTLISRGVQLKDWEPKDASNPSFNLNEYVASSDYHEYTKGTQMGSVSSIIMEPFNPAQRYLSEWQLRELNKPTTIEPYALELQAVEFSQSSESDSIALINLDEPLIINKPNEDDQTKIETLTIRQIAFAPQYQRKNRFNPTINLIADSGNVISLGSFKTAETNTTTEIVVGKQRISLTTNAAVKTARISLNSTTH